VVIGIGRSPWDCWLIWLGVCLSVSCEWLCGSTSVLALVDGADTARSLHERWRAASRVMGVVAEGDEGR